MRGVWLEQPGQWSVTDVADAKLLSGGVLVDVMAVRVPSYTREVLSGELGYDLPVPLVPGPACIGRIRAVSDDVFGLQAGDVALCNSLYSSGDVVGSPDEILIGWTGTGTERSARMQRRWQHGSFAEQACYPADCVTPLRGAEHWSRPELLPFLASLAIADGGLRRGNMRGGQTVIINGGTGNLGAAGVFAALGRGAARVVATGRRQEALVSLEQLDQRVRTVRLTGDRVADADALLAQSDGGADVLLDVIGQTPTPDPTLACFDALRANATAVWVGGVPHDVPLPYPRIQRRQLTVTGSFMFERGTALEMWQMVRSGAIDLSALRPQVYDLERFDEALAAAATSDVLDYAVISKAASSPAPGNPSGVTV
jgi:threonine dehydrogenase-like Zn-dependent dehydrogenase